MDQHEPLHTYLYAGQLADRWRDELVAGHPDDLPGKYDRVGAHDPEWAGRRKIRHPLPGLRPCQLRSKGREHTGNVTCDRSLRMVRHSDMDRRLRTLSDAASVDPFAERLARNITHRLGIADGAGYLLFSFLAFEYVGGLARRGQHPEIVGVQGVLSTVGRSCPIILGDQQRAWRSGARAGNAF